LRTQMELLKSQWSALDHKILLPLVERVARRYRDFPILNSVDALDFNRVSAAAFERWYEMAPVEARTAAMAEMMRPRPRFGAEDLSMVGDEPLPAVEHTLVEHLARLQDFDVARNIASLIQRFATPAVESDVVQILDRDV